MAVEEPRASDGLEHLQRAAKELVAAARSFLEVAEEVVQDDQRFADAASTVAGLVRDGVEQIGALGGEPEWWRDAWTEWRAGSAEPSPSGEPADEGSLQGEAGAEWRVPDDDEVDDTPVTRVRRVRRVALDTGDPNP